MSHRSKFVKDPPCARMVGKTLKEVVEFEGFGLDVAAQITSYKRLRTRQKQKLTYSESHRCDVGQHGGQVFHKFTNGPDEVGMCSCGKVMSWGELMRRHKVCDTLRNDLEIFCQLQPETGESSDGYVKEEPSDSFGDMNRAFSEASLGQTSWDQASLDSFGKIAQAMSEVSSMSCGSSLHSYGNKYSHSIGSASSLKGEESACQQLPKPERGNGKWKLDERPQSTWLLPNYPNEGTPGNPTKQQRDTLRLIEKQKEKDLRALEEARREAALAKQRQPGRFSA